MEVNAAEVSCLTEWLAEWLPAYCRVPLLVWFVLNCVVFFGARWINRNAVYHNFTLPIDRKLPMVPAFIVVYVLAYLSWIAGFWLIALQGPEACGVIFGEIISKFICLIIFITVPTEMEKPPVEDKNFFGWLCRFIFGMDEPNTLLPSIHCLENWMVWRGMLGFDTIPKAVKIFFFVYMLLVFVSTLLLKQHLIVDIPAAILVGEIGLWLAQRLQLGAHYAAWWASKGALL